MLAALAWPVVAIVALVLGARFAELLYRQQAAIALQERENSSRCDALAHGLAAVSERMTALENRVRR